MAALNDLPAEMLIKILEEVHLGDPGDMRNMALISKRFLPYCLPYTRVDAQTKVFYEGKFSSGSPHDAFEIAVSEPRSVYFITKLWLCDTVDYLRMSGPRTTYRHTGLIKRLNVIPKQQIFEWSRDLEKGEQCQKIAILLTMLPNLVQMRFERFLDPTLAIARVIKLITTGSSPNMLSKLKTVETTMFEAIKAFAQVPSVTKLVGRNTGHPSEDFESGNQLALGRDYSAKMHGSPMNDDPTSLESSNIIDLTLAPNASSRSGFEEAHWKAVQHFLTRCKSLKRLIYDAARYCRKDYYITVSPSQLLETLPSDSLETLELQFCNVERTWPVDPMPLLRSFEQLTTLALDLSLLVNHVSGSASPDGEHLPLEVLPKSIQILKIHHHRPIPTTSIGNFMNDVVRSKESLSLPNLHQVEVDCFGQDRYHKWDREAAQKIIDSCQSKGIILRLREWSPLDDVSPTGSTKRWHMTYECVPYDSSVNLTRVGDSVFDRPKPDPHADLSN